MRGTNSSTGHILGLSYNYHDAAAVLLRDGKLVAASTEERHTRKKHDSNFPERAIAACLGSGGITSKDLDWVAYYEQPLVKFGRILETSARHWLNGGRASLRSAVDSWARKGKFEVREQIAHALERPADRILFCDHHLSHAASAYFCSPFDRATVITLDGVGEWETGTISAAIGNAIRKRLSIKLPDSLGLFYSVMTAFLGFEVNEGEYKVMGMAGFGQPVFADQMQSWFKLRRDGSFSVRRDLLNHATGERSIPVLLDALGPSRAPESSFDPNDNSADFGSSRHYANVAASVQAVTENVVEHVARAAIQKTGIPVLCMAGGVALNSAANQRLRRVFGVPMFVQPAAGDAGGALGAAKWLYHVKLAGTARDPLTSAAWGSNYSRDAMLTDLRSVYRDEWKEFDDEDAFISAVADLLANEKVVGWFHGRSEWGPRALGYRSILASPCKPEMQGIVNEKIKFREPFRPFAPAVLAERASEFFELIDIPGEDSESGPYNFMLAVCKVRSEVAALIPAVTHVDGTARVQTVRSGSNRAFYRLIKAFEARTGVPVLLNTSFNLRGEPIVETPRDAINTFEWSGMDALAMGRFLVRK